MNRPEFTREQEDWICYVIGEWYSQWESKIVPNGSTAHRLGYAQEQLKTLLCDKTKSFNLDNRNQFLVFVFAKTLLIKERNKIIDNPFKRFIPYYKKKLSEIDGEIEKLELAYYGKQPIEIEGLNEMVSEAQVKLDNTIANLHKQGFVQ